MKLKDVLEKMTALNTDIEAMAAKCDAEEDAEKRNAMQEEINAKVAEFDGMKAKAADIRAKNERKKELEALKAHDNEIEAKTNMLTDVRVEKTEHNQDVWQKQRDEASKAYLIEGAKTLNKIANDNENLVDSIKAKNHKEDGGIIAPSYFRDHILTNKFIGKTEYHVLTSDASGSQSGGGSLVPFTFVNELFKIPQTVDRLMDKCFVKRAVAGTAYFPKLTQTSTEPFGITVSWVAEGSAITEHDPVFSQVTIGTDRLACLSYVSDKELRVNAVGLEAEMATMFRSAMSRAISVAILQGTGSSQPTGINSGTAKTGGVALVSRETADQVSYTDLVNLQFAVDEGVSGTGMFVLGKGPSSAYKYISALDDTYGRPVLRDYTTWGAGMNSVPQLAGSEYLATPANTASLGLTGDVIFGDFGCYGLAIDQDITIARSDDYAFNSGLVTFRVQAYVGGKPLAYTCFSMLDDASGESSSSST